MHDLWLIFPFAVAFNLALFVSILTILYFFSDSMRKCTNRLLGLAQHEPNSNRRAIVSHPQPLWTTPSYFHHLHNTNGG